MPIFGSSGRVSNPLANLGLLLAIAGVACSAILWLYHFEPESTLLGSYSGQIASNGQLHDQIRVLAAVCGLSAAAIGIITSMGGRGSPLSVFCVVLGVVALSYPVLTWLDVVERLVPNPVT
jgi:hypothetical protein